MDPRWKEHTYDPGEPRQDLPPPGGPETPVGVLPPVSGPSAQRASADGVGAADGDVRTTGTGYAYWQAPSSVAPDDWLRPERRFADQVRQGHKAWATAPRQ